MDVETIEVMIDLKFLDFDFVVKALIALLEKNYLKTMIWKNIVWTIKFGILLRIAKILEILLISVGRGSWSNSAKNIEIEYRYSTKNMRAHRRVKIWIFAHMLMYLSWERL